MHVNVEIDGGIPYEGEALKLLGHFKMIDVYVGPSLHVSQLERHRSNILSIDCI
jgi:hypothetical protein